MFSRLFFAATLLAAMFLLFVLPAEGVALGDQVVLSWNDLGMHCMNQYFVHMAILPPYNNQLAQVIQRGDSVTAPSLKFTGITVEYSIPGNTYSVGKTDFWTYAFQLFGVTLPPNIGLTGKGLTGSLDLVSTHFVANGIPVTPFTDANPTTEDPFQQTLIIVRDTGGNELCRSTPVIPVSSEIHCVSAGCHASETAILNQHENVPGYNPAATPILCSCHADPALGTTGRPDAGYFSLRMHDAHSFMDGQFTGTNLCYHCHPGPVTQCLRGVMAQKWGLVCEDCHGGMANMALSIEGGRIPWVQEPACRTCHTARFGEPNGQLYKLSTGHGGVYCEGCHGSTHAEYVSREPRDNANMVALQGHSGVLSDCSVCHRIIPSTAGPHGMVVTDVVEQEVLGGAQALRVFPNPMREACTIEVHPAAARGGSSMGSLMVYDARGRAVALVRPSASEDGTLRAAWDGRRSSGEAAPPGVYFIRWQQGEERAAARVILSR